MIRVVNLTKVFHPDNVLAVDNVSFSIPKGEIACVIGTSGCGKTTLMKMLNRLVDPSAGEIYINNRLHSEHDPIAWRRNIGYVIQKAGLLPHLNVKDNISLLSKILKRKDDAIDKRVRELMEVINMPFEKFATRYPAELSGGQQQRVGIARALMEDPPVMLMDEPFGALDPITRHSLHQEFYALNQRLQKTIIIVTHDMEEAFKLGDKIIVMNQGKIVQMGTGEELRNNPKNEFVSSFLKSHRHV